MNLETSLTKNIFPLLIYSKEALSIDFRDESEAGIINGTCYPFNRHPRITFVNNTSGDVIEDILRTVLRLRIMQSVVGGLLDESLTSNPAYSLDLEQLHGIKPIVLQESFPFDPERYDAVAVVALQNLILDMVHQLRSESGFDDSLRTYNKKLEKQFKEPLRFKAKLFMDPVIQRHLFMLDRERYHESETSLDLRMKGKIFIMLSVEGDVDKEALHPFKAGYVGFQDGFCKDNNYVPCFSFIRPFRILGVINLITQEEKHGTSND